MTTDVYHLLEEGDILLADDEFSSVLNDHWLRLGDSHARRHTGTPVQAKSTRGWNIVFRRKAKVINNSILQTTELPALRKITITD